MSTQLESTNKSANPQRRIDEGDTVKVVVKKKIEKGDMPDWSDANYTVESRAKGRGKTPLTHTTYQPIIDSKHCTY